MTSPITGSSANSVGRRAASVADEEAASVASDSSDEDAALEAMLEAEAATGEVLFHDDFDAFNADLVGDVPRKKRRALALRQSRGKNATRPIRAMKKQKR